MPADEQEEQRLPQESRRRGPGRPRKEKKAEPITATMRLSVDLIEEIERYQKQQTSRSGRSLPKKDLMEKAWKTFAARREDEMVSLALLLAREERTLMERLMRYLAHTPKSATHRKMIFPALDSIADLAQYLGRRESNRR